MSMSTSLKIPRILSRREAAAHQQIQWKTVRVVLEKKGRIVYDGDVEVPAQWSQNAANILADKYLRRAGVPDATVPRTPILDTGVFEGFTASIPAPSAKFGAETSARQVFHRLAGAWTHAAITNSYISDAQNARAFYDEIFLSLALQMAAPNSPQWFNTGLWWAYGIEGSESGAGYYWDTVLGEVERATTTYRRPQTSACFIIGLNDSLLDDGGIIDGVSREARIFKFGSGSGINYSTLRPKGAPLSNGGDSSGMMSFLKLFDANAGTIKSGGTTRRAARMVIVDADHPEAEDFVVWKAQEEIKAHALRAAASSAKLPNSSNDIAASVIAKLAKSEYEDEASATISGQNANNSLRVSDQFMERVTDAGYEGKEKRLFDKVLTAAWMCGDPGLQFDDTINRWHTIPKHSRQRATNPCSEYAFIDDSSCNLASLNLWTFLKGGIFDVHLFRHVARLWTIVLDVTIEMSAFPDPKVAENTAKYRALGLGYANLGGLLMAMGLPYDSTQGRHVAALVTAVLHGTAWEASAELAAVPALAAFYDFDKHADDVARVYRLHVEAAQRQLLVGFNGSDNNIESVDALERAVEELWAGTPDADHYRRPIRNAQLTLLAPTGTTGLVMDCATTGVEPAFSLTAYKQMAGGGSMSIVNPLIPDALCALGYRDTQVVEIAGYAFESGTIDISCPHIKREHIAVFDCANDISVAGHIGMMAAVQPFLSGAISKTVNMPATASEADIASAYVLAWEQGIKAIAIYRDGCKGAQPLTAVRVADSSAPAPVANVTTLSDPHPLAATSDFTIGFRGDALAPVVSARIVAGTKKRNAPRHILPSRRNGFRQKVRISGQTLYLATGEYSDGKLGEVFMTFGRDGTIMRHLLELVGRYDVAVVAAWHAAARDRRRVQGHEG